MKFISSSSLRSAWGDSGEGEIIFGGKNSRSRGEGPMGRKKDMDDLVTHILPNPVDREKSLRNTDDSLLHNTDGGTLKNTEG